MQKVECFSAIPEVMGPGYSLSFESDAINPGESSVFAAKELGKGDNLARQFRLRLGIALMSAPSLAGWKATPIHIAVGNPRMVVGSMNNIRQLMAWRGESAVSAVENDEDWINDTPFLSLPGYFPCDAFADRLAAAHVTR